MMKYIYFLICCLFAFQVTAQRDTKEVISAEGIHSVSINTNEVYLIRITTSKDSIISFSTHSEGEYFKEIILKSEVKNGKLLLSTEYPEILTGGYDKLSAHKVFSLEIEMSLPEDMEVIVNSNIASLVAKGKYESVYAQLKEGYCHLLDFSGSAVINTYKGDILVETSRGVIDASSRHGKIEIPDFLPGRKPLRLTSIDGNILVRKN